MIKGNVTVCGTINSSAVEKTSKENEKYLSFSMVVPLQGKDESIAELIIHVSVPMDAKMKSKLTNGRHVLVHGVLHVRKYEGTVFYNVRSDEEVELVKTSEPDSLEGDLEFKGGVGTKGVTEKTSKKGSKYHLFDAWSRDKSGEKDPEYTWVHFICFQKDFPALTPKNYVHVTGKLDIDVFKGNASINCVADTVEVVTFEDNKTDDKQADNK